MDEQERNAFLDQVAHDIRSPITTIAGFAELLERTFDEGDQRRSYLHAIQRAVGRLGELAERVSREAAKPNR